MFLYTSEVLILGIRILQKANIQKAEKLTKTITADISYESMSTDIFKLPPELQLPTLQKLTNLFQNETHFNGNYLEGII